VTEVPEHLLRRAKERRAAMTGEATGDEGAASADTSKAVEPAAAATPAAGGSGAGTPSVPTAPVPPPYTGPPPSAPRKQRVPVWAGVVLAALPLWAVLYGGAFGERSSGETGGPVAQGALVYKSAGCSGCHGPTGGGGVGPALANVTKTFPDFADHVSWVRTGSKPFQGKPYGATGKVATGGMPAFADLTDEEVIAVVCHERVTYGKADPLPPECEEGAQPDAGDAGSGGGGEGDADSASAES
jgi:mono/diheme cytochrome c family protein